MLRSKIAILLISGFVLSACNQQNACDRIKSAKNPVQFIGEIITQRESTQGGGDFAEPIKSVFRRQVYREDDGFTVSYEIRDDGIYKNTSVYGLSQSSHLYKSKNGDRKILWSYDPNPEVNFFGNRKSFSTLAATNTDGKIYKYTVTYKYIRDEQILMSGCQVRTSVYEISTKLENSQIETITVTNFSPELKTALKFEAFTRRDKEITSKFASKSTDYSFDFSKAPEP